jgi:hypothetical protein
VQGKMAEHLFKNKFEVSRLDPDGDKGNLSLASLRQNCVSSSEAVKPPYKLLLAIEYFVLSYAVFSMLITRLFGFLLLSCCKYRMM